MYDDDNLKNDKSYEKSLKIDNKLYEKDIADD